MEKVIPNYKSSKLGMLLGGKKKEHEDLVVT